ncbi:MAG: hypothetical protein ACRDHZ_07515 [Ktedonobacteraceae bacterium]
MRVAAVALVLMVGAAMVLIFANTLNSWVLGGLLGGLAALLLSIPISLALFTFLARRHNALLRPQNRSLQDEPEFPKGFYDEHMVYEAEVSYADEELLAKPRTRYLLEERSLPASGYLRLPAAGHSLASSQDDEEEVASRHEPRNYPRQPRSSSSSRAQTSHVPPRPGRGETGYQYSTHALSQHQSEALRAARQEAQHQRSGSEALSHHVQESRTQALQRARATRQLRARRALEERETWVSEPEDERPSWYDEGDNYAPERHQRASRPVGYPRQPRQSAETRREDAAELDEPPTRRSRTTSTNLPNPLASRASSFYNEEATQQMEVERPIDRRRPSRYQRREYDEG